MSHQYFPCTLVITNIEYKKGLDARLVSAFKTSHKESFNLSPSVYNFCTQMKGKHATHAQDISIDVAGYLGTILSYRVDLDSDKSSQTTPEVESTVVDR